jgi:hypothetical protein
MLVIFARFFFKEKASYTYTTFYIPLRLVNIKYTCAILKHKKLLL